MSHTEVVVETVLCSYCEQIGRVDEVASIHFQDSYVCFYCEIAFDQAEADYQAWVDSKTG